MNKWIAGLFASVLVIGVARADVGAPAPSAKDLEKVVEEVNYVETAKAGIVLSGYVDVGYIYNFNGTHGGSRRGANDSVAKGDFNVNAVKLTLEKPLTDANEFQAGFRVDLMVGEDIATNGGNAGPGNLSGDSLLVEQAYVAIRAPYGNGIDIKAGKFVTWLGYEVIERPANLNITYGNLFFNAIPLYHTGVSAEYAFNDTVDGGIAVTNGFNNDSTSAIDAGNSEDGYGVMAKINITNPGGNANWYNAVYYGFGNGGLAAASNNDIFVWDSWGNWAPTAFDDKLLLGFNTDIGVKNSETYWGAALYAKYQFTDIFSLAGRADYLHSDSETGAFNTPGAGGPGHTDTWSWTMTAGFDLLENLLVRAEYRVDLDGDFAIGGDDYHTIALQAVYTF